MELKDFIKETILQIIAGVKNAQEEVIQFGAYVSAYVYQIRQT